MAFLPDATDAVTLPEQTYTSRMATSIAEAQQKLYFDKAGPLEKDYIGYTDFSQKNADGSSPFVKGKMSNEYDYSQRVSADLAQAQNKQAGPFLANRGGAISGNAAMNEGYGIGMGLGSAQAKLSGRNDAAIREMNAWKSGLGFGADTATSTANSSAAAAQLATQTADRAAAVGVARSRGTGQFISDVGSAYASGVYKSGGEANPFSWKNAVAEKDAIKYRPWGDTT